MEAEHHPQGLCDSFGRVRSGKPRRENVWGCGACRDGARETEDKNATRDRKLARCHQLIQRLQHKEHDGGVYRDGQPCASDHTVL